MKIFLPLLLIFLFKQVFPQSDMGPLGTLSEPRFMVSTLRGWTDINFDNPNAKAQWTLGVKNIWSQQNVNMLTGQWAYQKSNTSGSIQAAWLSHPFWKNSWLGGNQLVQLGEHTTLTLRLGAQHQKWNQEWAPWEWHAGIGTSFMMDKWSIQCSSHWQPKWENGKVQNQNSLLIGAQLQLAQNVRLLAASQWQESFHYKTQCTIQWQNEKRWQFSAGVAWPAWMWSIGIAWQIQNWSHGMWMDQSAWTRPSLDYRIRYEK